MLLNSLRLQGGVSRPSGCALGARESLYLQGGMPGTSGRTLTGAESLVVCGKYSDATSLLFLQSIPFPNHARI